MIIISPLTLYPTPSEAPLTYQLTLSIKKKKVCILSLSFTHTQNTCEPFLLHQTKTLVHMLEKNSKTLSAKSCDSKKRLRKNIRKDTLKQVFSGYLKLWIVNVMLRLNKAGKGTLAKHSAWTTCIASYHILVSF